MKHALFRVTTTGNKELDDDDFVESIMDRLLIDYPQIQGYQYERVTKQHINILIWGDIEIVH